MHDLNYFGGKSLATPSLLERNWECFSHSFHGLPHFSNCRNCITGIFTERFAATDPALAKAQMLGSAATFAVKKQFQKVIFYCDSALVVTFFNDRAKEMSNLNLEGAATRFFNTCQSLDCYKLLNIPRKENFMVHNSAKWARANLTIGEIELSAIDGEVLSDFQEWFPDPG
ncbi:hypothetical protein G4B88_028194 [Cannabis sativa]|uniref:RNase H type-1 domain-containing protein n=1 Tax=Cannabis sativa TaxID=3483 RepID=A0A7J6HVF3_CANSA|nr:hypothetical protein G4B88_028194 [Cannabis sativa]